MREAITRANSDPSITSILVETRVPVIRLASSLIYSGHQPLRIHGPGIALQPARGSNQEPDSDTYAFPLLVSLGGGDLELSGLTVKNSLRSGVEVHVPADAIGEITVDLINVTLEANALYGLYIDDSAGSAAGVRLRISSSSILNNGSAATDLDGVRIDESGAGGASVIIQDSSFSLNGADGLEIDESGEGDILLAVSNASFNGNGYFDPEDLEDGIDLDEAGPGSVIAQFSKVAVAANHDEGIDLDEAGPGHLHTSMSEVRATLQGDKGVNLTEADEGNLDVVVGNSDFSANDDDGLQFRESEDGSIFATITEVTAHQNDFAFDFREAGAGNLELAMSNTSAVDNRRSGLDFREAGAGNLLSLVSDSEFLSNTEWGIDVRQAGSGSGSLTLDTVSIAENGSGGISLQNVSLFELP